MGGLLSSLLSSFFSQKMELAVVGLDNAGKSTLLNVLTHGIPGETLPTIGLSVSSFKRGNITFKAWDIAGQSAYRGEWGRYAAGVDVLMFVVDSSDGDRLSEARIELHRLLELPSLTNTPICIVANKVDITPHVSESELIKALNLDYIMDQPWVVIPVSARYSSNIDALLQWLVKQKATKT